MSSSSEPLAVLPLTWRACARYAAPFVVLSMIALAPVWLFEIRASRGQIDVNRARAELHLAWQAIAVLWMFQLAVVAAIAPAIRALVDGTPLSQWHALRDGARNLVRAIVPIGAAVACIAIAGLALAIPALLVFPLVALTGASRALAQPLPAPIVDSVAIARRRYLPIAAIAVAIIALDVLIVFAAQHALISVLPAQPGLDVLLRFNTFLRVTIAALILLTPLPAAALVASYERAR